jgi:hypothetical protein
MTKFRLAAGAVTTSCALMLVGGAGTAAAQDTETKPLTQTIAMTGTAKNGKQFNGTYTIKRFEAEGDDVFAVGTLKSTLKGRHVFRRGVRIPVTGVTKDVGTAQAAAVCDVLHLTLGPLDLNLLGLRVQLNQVKLDITAISGNTPGAGLLGNLLCGLTNLFDPTNVVGDLLSRILNSLLALVPRA